MGWGLEVASGPLKVVVVGGSTVAALTSSNSFEKNTQCPSTAARKPYATIRCTLTATSHGTPVS